MIDLHLAIFLPAAALLSASPGPSNLLSMTHGMQVGMRKTALSLIGRGAAFALMIIMVAVGLGAVLETSELAFAAVKWCGVAYLAYIGIKLLRTKEVPVEESGAGLSAGQLMRREFWVALTNPKAMLIFSAFLPQFVQGSGSYTEQLLILGSIFLVIEFFVACGYGLSGVVLGQFRTNGSNSVLLNRISGGMMLGAAALLATVRRD